ncbi:MAG: dual specificity protein phosphatase family protein [Candidatus Nitrosocosmicus sp.]|nr:dual specificity protein phosphatase family protein [Candidatus Nitrosocosmicus sp.]MDN5866665.1 dual specificity protein phosphatase family protein [Candidatus Nitrosocosmicus sp.]
MLFKIVDNKLAIASVWDHSYQILNESMYQTDRYENAKISWHVLDVRDLNDDSTNSLERYKEKIDLAWELIQEHGKVVICCVAGRSRSNAIALGVLIKYFGMDFYKALEFIKSKVPRSNIDPAHLEKLKNLFHVTLP